MDLLINRDKELLKISELIDKLIDLWDEKVS